MSSAVKHKPPRSDSKLDKFLARPGDKRRPDLAVDTNISRHGGRMPLQVYPPPAEITKERGNFVSLNDVTRLSQHDTKPRPVAKGVVGFSAHIRPGPNRSVKSTLPDQIPKSAVAEDAAPPPYQSIDSTGSAARQPFVLQNPPKRKRNNALNRLVPRRSATDVSPSDAKIEIGMAISPGAVQYHKDSIASESSRPPSSPRRMPSIRSGQELRPPTIVVTPVNEDFEASFNRFTSYRGEENRDRPRSSVYSRYTNGLSKIVQFDRAPPVPPIPKSAVWNGRKARNVKPSDRPVDASQKSLPALPALQTDHNRAASICTTFSEDQVEQSSLGTPSKHDRFSTQTGLWNSRSSQGWWNILKSPFSAISATRTLPPSPFPIPEYESQRNMPLTSNKSEEFLLEKRLVGIDSKDDNELRSAPATESSVQSFVTRQPRTPKRANTAPGALDLGNADMVNIYRAPSHGSASSYYDQTRNYPSIVVPAVGVALDRGIEPGWSPSQSVYRGSGSDSTRNLENTHEAFPHTQIPTTGEAAPYYDRNRRFSSTDEPRYLAGGSGNDRAFIESPVSDVSLHSGTTSPDRTPYGLSPNHPSSSSGESDMVLDDGLHQRPTKGGNSSSVDSHHAAMGSDTTSSIQQTSRGIVEPTSAPLTERQRTPLHGQVMSSRSDSGQISDDNSSDDDLSFTERHYSEKYPWGAVHGEKFRGADMEGDGRQLVPWYRRMLGLLVLCAALLLVALIVLLVAFVPTGHTNAQVEAEWLALNGFPPLPTGVATVIGAKLANEVSGCVDREALWSCAAPPGEGLSTTQLDQPNFRFLIRFRNGTIANSTLVEPTNSTIARRDSGRAVNAGALARRDALNNFLYTSNPPAPSLDNQRFLGRTTDGAIAPFAGEETPFYISLLDPVALRPEKRSLLQKRAGFHYPYPTPSDSDSSAPTSSSSATSSSPSPSQEQTESIPSPALQDNGDPAPAKLYPFAYAQPLKLFNRGQGDEHYAFYTYFDRSIFLSSFANGTFLNASANRARNAGNVRLEVASSVCTWSESRLLVQIFTRKPDVTTLAPVTNMSISVVNSTANDMESPGSFPYEVTVTLDRHGGDASKKALFCYNLDEDHHVIHDSGAWVMENRAFHGEIVNPAAIPTNNGTLVASGDKGIGDGGIDGGSGGCSCQWKN